MRHPKIQPTPKAVPPATFGVALRSRDANEHTARALFRKE
jgi:hypothetical protein